MKKKCFLVLIAIGLFFVGCKTEKRVEYLTTVKEYIDSQIEVSVIKVSTQELQNKVMNSVVIANAAYDYKNRCIYYTIFDEGTILHEKIHAIESKNRGWKISLSRDSMVAEEIVAGEIGLLWSLKEGLDNSSIPFPKDAIDKLLEGLDLKKVKQKYQKYFQSYEGMYGDFSKVDEIVKELRKKYYIRYSDLNSNLDDTPIYLPY